MVSFPYFRNCIATREMYIFVLVIVISNIAWLYQYRKNGHWRAKHYSEGIKQQGKKPSKLIKEK
jgi:hypothetical protein